MIGPGCSDDVAALSGPEIDEYFNSSTDPRSLVISPWSQALSLRDPIVYPNVVRVTSSTIYVIRAMIEVIGGFNWRRIAVLNDNSLWGNTSAQAFINEFLAIEGRTVLNLGSTSFSLAAFQSGAGERGPMLLALPTSSKL